MNKKELIKHIEDLPYNEGLIVDTIKISRNGLLKLIEQLDEPGKVKVPQFVADWIEESKQHCENVVEFFGCRNLSFEITKWIEEGKRFDLIARAWLDGYEIEEEKRYWVKVKGTGQCLEKTGSAIHFSTLFKFAFTKKELEEVGFGEVFNSPLFEVEEVAK